MEGEETRRGMREKVRGIGEEGNTGKWGVCVCLSTLGRRVAEKRWGRTREETRRGMRRRIERLRVSVCVCVLSERKKKHPNNSYNIYIYII